jgi:predicted nucleotidyltransferase
LEAQEKLDDELLEKIAKENGLKDNRIALFESALTGNMHPDSDIDMIVVSKNFLATAVPSKLNPQILNPQIFDFLFPSIRQTEGFQG